MPAWGPVIGEENVARVTEYVLQISGQDHDAALAAEGETNLFELEHLKRGYENIEDKLSNLGAEIS